MSEVLHVSPSSTTDYIGFINQYLIFAHATSSSDNTYDQRAEHAVDPKSPVYWASNNTYYQQTLTVHLIDYKIRCTHYSFRTYYSTSCDHAVSWCIEGYNGSQWIPIDTVSNSGLSSINRVLQRPVSSSQFFYKFRLTQLSLNARNFNHFVIDKIDFFGEAFPVKFDFSTKLCKTHYSNNNNLIHYIRIFCFVFIK